MGRTQKRPERTQIRIVDVLDEYDLRKVISQKAYLKTIVDQFKLQDMEAVLFTNRNLTRFRMVLRVRDTPYVCAPNIDKQEQHSLFLKISEELCHLAKSETVIKIQEIRSRSVTERPEINERIKEAIDANRGNR